MNIACLGSRALPPEAVTACREMGLALVGAGYTVVTGATPGVPRQDEWANWADGAFATGAYHSHPGRLIACLPWRHFPRGSTPPSDLTVAYPEEHPEWAEVARGYWEAAPAGLAGPWAVLRRSSRLRIARVAGVLLQARLLLAWPQAEDEEMRFALGFAAWRQLPAIDLTLVSWREVLAALVAQAHSDLAALG